jgi:CubicO group peptidase (beta-lactamase class C family)
VKPTPAGLIAPARAVALVVALVVALALAALPAALSAQQPAGPDVPLAGVWEGALETPAGLVPLSLDLERTSAGWVGTFSFPSEGVRDLPLGDVEVHGDSVLVAIPPRVVFHGRLAGDDLVGVARLGEAELPLVFARAGSPAAEAMAARIAASMEALRAAPWEAAATGPGLDRVDRVALDRLLHAAGASHSHALVVLHDGDLVGTWYPRGGRRKIEAMSATKSVVSLAVGRLLTTGALESIDVPVHAFYPEWSDGPKSRITIRHLLNHTSGIEAGRTAEAIYASDDFVRFALDADLASEPGEAIFYNNSATNLLAGVVGEAAGQRMDLFLRDDLFARLGITDFGWSLDPAGNPHGMAGLQILAEDFARIGQLVLQRGEWEGERLIDDAWFDASMAPGSELSPRVGLLWWLIRDDEGDVIGYRADGYLGQYLVVYPGERLVGVRMVSQSPAYDAGTDGFPEFQAMLRALVPSPDG